MNFFDSTGFDPVHTSYYDGQGGFTGTSVTTGDSTVYYDAASRYRGSSFSDGVNTRFYNERSEFTGSSVTYGDLTTFYDSDCNLAGRAFSGFGSAQYYDQKGNMKGTSYSWDSPAAVSMDSGRDIEDLDEDELEEVCDELGCDPEDLGY